MAVTNQYKYYKYSPQLANGSYKYSPADASYKYSPQMTAALVKMGLSQRGVDQLLAGQVITDPADRQVAAEVLWNLWNLLSERGWDLKTSAPGSDRMYHLKGAYHLKKP